MAPSIFVSHSNGNRYPLYISMGLTLTKGLPYQPQTKKDTWRPKLEALVDELAAEYRKLLAEGIVGPGDLPEATEDTAIMLFNATDVTGDFKMNQFWEKLSKNPKR